MSSSSSIKIQDEETKVPPSDGLTLARRLSPGADDVKTTAQSDEEEARERESIRKLVRPAVQRMIKAQSAAPPPTYVFNDPVTEFFRPGERIIHDKNSGTIII